MALPITRVVLYKHGVGYFERAGSVDGDAALALTFKQDEVSDVLKSLTVLDLSGGHVTSVSYDSTKPLEQLLAEIALSIPDQESVMGLLPQIKGARVALHSGVGEPIEGTLLGVDSTERQTGDGIVKIKLVAIVTDHGEVRSFDLHNLAGLQILDTRLRADLDYYLRTQLSAKKKDTRTFTFFAQGEGRRDIRLSYTLEAPVWKATYRILLDADDKPPMIQGWAVVDNTQDEDWENVQLSLVSGLPVSFVHDLYTPRYIRRPEVRVEETTGVLPPQVEHFMEASAVLPIGLERELARIEQLPPIYGKAQRKTAISSTPVQTRERKLGDLFEYEIEHPVTIRRNQSALVPIVLRSFEGRPVLLYNKVNRAENPMRCVDFKNTTGLTLEGGPVSVLEAGNYVGEAMLDTLKPDEQRLVPYAVELGVTVLDNLKSFNDRVHRVVIRRGQMQSFYEQVQQTTYHFNNKSEDEQVLYLDHPRPGQEWKLVETAAPHEVTENRWRFRFVLPAKKVSAFVVKQKHVQHQAIALNDVKEQTVNFWLQQRYLDGATEGVLREVLKLRDEAARFDQAGQRLGEERDKIDRDQKRIRENLQTLGDRSTEKELRERYVRTLQNQEDRLEEIERASAEHTAARTDCWERINELLGKLDYEATL